MDAPAVKAPKWQRCLQAIEPPVVKQPFYAMAHRKVHMLQPCLPALLQPEPAQIPEPVRM